jgi:lipopolysaccharide transport system ATP-binding protein
MADVAITVETLSKRYLVDPRIAGHQDTLREIIDRNLRQWTQRAYDFARGRSLRRDREAEEFWALRDVSFALSKGDVLGVIGRNGAGKSTLLKILSRVTEPTSGRVEFRGRVASLLEVGTGFHPELTGRENIFLNGAILGMKRKEIQKRLDEIVAFAEIDRFLDTPVKKYSSGMYVRLAFAVAAHLDADIMLIDEVLAVGDVQFQRKCLDRIGEAQRGGRTILFVSHNLTAVRALCRRCIVLDKGRILMDGDASEAITCYLTSAARSPGERTIIRWSAADAPASADVMMISALAKPIGGDPFDPIDVATGFQIVWEYRVLSAGVRLVPVVTLYNEQGVLLFNVGPGVEPSLCAAGSYRSSCEIPGNFLNDGVYFVSLTLRDDERVVLDLPNCLRIEMLDSGDRRRGWFGKWEGILRPVLSWTTQALPDLPPTTQIQGR